MLKPNYVLTFVVSAAIALACAGCESSTPQASEEMKKQVMGRKPTPEELSAAMSKAMAGAEKAKAEALAKAGK